ncbi:MAG: bifunctional fucokinase/fucose-1-phosphate guanylyltransferase [Firmicutes bacterium]|nr:bifunctional fucokinase/fucose-1-phosphate guanylyltransferase [Bacillota bacterium]MCM1401642.1 bifunctional fucokinase/fucose-1-phosphate guanylyltransferase [Bacteroides sp.]MCM1477528.1 bifunctional fucokinase/fucose-1-phosphate guanylyltransferase [Bacteroides sp.]
MNILLSLPPDVVRFKDLMPVPAHVGCRYVDSDPVGRRLGSGGGTVWMLQQFHERHPEASGPCIIIHAGGQSRRLPAYAAVGKSMTPMPVLRWSVGNAVDQTLLDLQLPLLEQIVMAAPAGLDTLVASGDVLVRNIGVLPEIPQADVVCFGIWAEPEQACNHGVFFTSRAESATGAELDFMLQKPSVAQLSELGRTHYFLMDIGLWLLSSKAVEKLRQQSTAPDGSVTDYDLYSQFGCALGNNPSAPFDALGDLTVAIIPLANARFHHFGTTRQLLSSTLELQNVVADQRRILHGFRKPNPALFVQNCHIDFKLTEENNNVWVENSHIGSGWTITSNNVITGVPENRWNIALPKGVCIDVVPVGESSYALRPYGFDDAMRGDVDNDATRFLGHPLKEWLAERDVTLDCQVGTDIQNAPLFVVTDNVEDMGKIAQWMISDPASLSGKKLWLDSEKISADEIMARANLGRLYAQRNRFLKENLPAMAANPVSVFYQLDLDDTAEKYRDFTLPAPAPLPSEETLNRKIHNYMLRSRVNQLNGEPYSTDEHEAFSLMRSAILDGIDVSRTMPALSVAKDQIVWGRSPVRIDLAGGWTDTPPYSLLNGGVVVNVAVELNGQPPLQVFVKPAAEHHILLRSIDLGATEVITDYSSLLNFSKVGSPFSLPKAALAIAGFAPGFSAHRFNSLKTQLEMFGSGIELTLLSALPAGSGMGTSSILAATVLGSLSDFCGLGWTSDEICERTLALEQLLTTGGGWQDQYGGVLQGVKLLQSTSGWHQTPAVSWLPDGLFTDARYAPCHLLYYTGITRTAKGILAEIVKRMFLNHGPSLQLLGSMKEHALEMAETIQRRDFMRYGQLVGKTWSQNKILDTGTCPEAVAKIIDVVSDYTLGLKLPGAGGGGYLYMVAKDPEAAAIIRRRLAEHGHGRFTEMKVSQTGLQISRS